ncbi:MAG TPA: isochorismatase family protein [Candidatus Limnocylindria bacterium]|nr:isochorismatase family protein [Candidatus Limnocylindria bacterium]
MPIWDPYLTARDREVFERSGHGQRAGFGVRPAVLVVDLTYAFVGDRPEPILDSIVRWHRSAGDDGWRAAGRIRTLLDAARAAGAPVIYTTGTDDARAGQWNAKNSRRAENEARPDRNTIVPEIAPCPGDLVLRKEKPSAFFGTPLAAHLVRLGVDSLFVTGGTTSGCVRASVVDAFSYSYRVALVEECLFDRGQASHALSLFDMQQKYADVVSLADALAMLSS